MRDIGRMGEDSFSFLCNSVGLTPNRVDADKNGWDFYVEFPSRNHTFSPIDECEGSHQCKVQVKATDKIAHSVAISLSNLNRLAKDPLPAFICLFVFRHLNEVQELYCIHVDEKLTEKILSSIRKKEACGQTNLHKHKLNIKFPPESKLPEATGNNLRIFIEGCIGKSCKLYTKKKLNMLERIGYPSHRYGVTVTLDTAEDYNKLQDAYLGIPTEIMVSDMRAFTTRFGIELPDHRMKSGRGVLKIGPIQGHEVTISFCERLQPPLKFESRLFVSNDDKRIRIVNKFFELRANLTENKMNIKPMYDLGSIFTSEEIYRLWKLLSIADKKGVSLQLDIVNGPSINFELNGGTAYPEAAKYLLLSKQVVDIFHYFEVDRDHKFSLNDLDAYNEQISALCKIIVGKTYGCKASFTLSGDQAHTLALPSVAAVGCLRIFACGLFFTLVVGLNGKLKQESDREYEIACDTFHVYNRWHSLDCFFPESELNFYIDSIVETLEESGQPVLVLSN